MRGPVHLLIALAVLWCGLHLSAAEADIAAPVGNGTSIAVQIDHQNADDHALPHVAHGCHSHCPVATDLTSGPALASPDVVPAPFFAMPRLRLPSLAVAPPTEPPSA